ncbi:MAG: methionyl-tRNA formyltransferase [Candidatus Aminicenantales bacterium]
MRIVFFGSPASALPTFEKLLQAGHIVELAITQPDRPAGRGKKLTPPPVKEFALSHDIPVLQPEKVKRDEKTLQAIQKINPDVNVVVAYGQIIPAAIYNLPRFKSLNVHFSLLPKYRGAAPVEWAILNGERKTGVTIFELNEKMDEGDILAFAEVEIFPEETATELEKRLACLGADLLVGTLDKLEELPRLPQDHSRATYAPRLKKEDGRIDWSAPALTIERKVRAFSTWPGAYSFLHGQRILICRGKKLAETLPGQRPGRIVATERNGLIVACGQDSLFLVERLQRENRKEMDAHAFLQGMKVDPGDFFE